jgi:hypothetical protein
MGSREVRNNKYAKAVAVLALGMFPTQILGQPIICTSPPPNPCGGNSNCVVNDDEWQVTIGPTGQITLSGRKVSRKELEEYAAVWAKQATYPIVVNGHTGTKYAQITSIVAMFRKAGVLTRVSCITP